MKFDEDVLRLWVLREEKTKNKSHHDDLLPKDEIIVKIVEKKKGSSCNTSNNLVQYIKGTKKKPSTVILIWRQKSHKT